MRHLKSRLQNTGLALLLAFAFTAHAAEPVADGYPIPQDKVVKTITGKKGSKLILSSRGNPATLNPFLYTDLETKTSSKKPRICLW